MKKVLVVGSSLQIGRTEELYRRGFAAAGWDVTTVVADDVWPFLSSRSTPARIANRVLSRRRLARFNAQVISSVRDADPDLVFVLGPGQLSPATVREISRHAPAFTFFTDNPLDAHHTHRNDWQDAALPMWDATFIWSESIARELQDVGVRRSVFHPFCCDLQYHAPQPQPARWDVAFLANWDDSGKRESFLSAITHVRLGLWGTNDWLSRPAVDLAAFYQGFNGYRDIPGIFGASRLALNIMRPQNMSGHNLRTFEIIACGAAMVSERTPELMRLFREDEEAVYFSTPDELRDKVDWLLGNPDLIDRIAAAGLSRRAANGIDARIREVEEVFAAATGVGRLSHSA